MNIKLPCHDHEGDALDMPLESSPLVVKVIGERCGNDDIAYHAQPVPEACENLSLERTHEINVTVCVANRGHLVS